MASCSICQEILKPDDNVQAIQCGHNFHEKCIHDWKNKSSNCPQCNGPVISMSQLVLKSELIKEEDSDSSSQDDENVQKSPTKKAAKRTKTKRSKISKEAKKYAAIPARVDTNLKKTKVAKAKAAAAAAKAAQSQPTTTKNPNYGLSLTLCKSIDEKLEELRLSLGPLNDATARYANSVDKYKQHADNMERNMEALNENLENYRNLATQVEAIFKRPQ